MVSAKRIFLLLALLVVASLNIRQLFISRLQTNPAKQIEVTNEARLLKPELSDGGQATSTGRISQGEMVTVAYVIDGDTIDLTDGRRVRYIGMDAPETAHAGKSAECFGKEAREENTRSVNGKNVRLEKDTSETDSYGRLLRYVFAGDTLVNEQLVRTGFARAWNVAPDEKYKDALFIAQQEAKVSGRGLWRLCRK